MRNVIHTAQANGGNLKMMEENGLVDEDMRITYCCKNTENKKCHV